MGYELGITSSGRPEEAYLRFYQKRPKVLRGRTARKAYLRDWRAPSSGSPDRSWVGTQPPPTSSAAAEGHASAPGASASTAPGRRPRRRTRPSPATVRRGLHYRREACTAASAARRATAAARHTDAIARARARTGRGRAQPIPPTPAGPRCSRGSAPSPGPWRASSSRRWRRSPRRRRCPPRRPRRARPAVVRGRSTAR